MADTVAKAFLGGRTKIFRAADAFCVRRREGPYRFIQNRPATFAVVLKSDTAAEKSKDQLSRDFPGRSIPVCTENLIRVDDVLESPKLAE